MPQEDFEQFLWTIVFLAMGGIALGKAVVSSGLLTTMDDGVRGLVEGLGLYEIVLVLSVVVLVGAALPQNKLYDADALRSRSSRRLSAILLLACF